MADAASIPFFIAIASALAARRPRRQCDLPAEKVERNSVGAERFRVERGHGQIR